MSVRVFLLACAFMTFADCDLRAQSYTPYTTPPQLVNRDVVRQQLNDALGKLPGVNGLTTQVWLLVETDGTTTGVAVRKSSGNPAADSAAVRIVRLMRWRPALKDGRPVATNVQLPVVFRTVKGKKAVAAGAEVIQEPKTREGDPDKRGGFRDPSGNTN